MKTSKFLSLSFKDYLKGLITAVGTALLMGLQQSLAAVPPHFPSTWAELQPICMAAVGGGYASVITPDGSPCTVDVYVYGYVVN